MKEGAASSPVYAFGPFRLDPARQELRRGDQLLALTPKAFDTLRMLVEAGGALVAKEDLLAAVWRDRFVEESVLSQNVYTLRKVLDEGNGGNPYIVTVPRRGYRLGVPILRLDGAAEPVATPPTPAGPWAVVVPFPAEGGPHPGPGAEAAPLPSPAGGWTAPSPAGGWPVAGLPGAPPPLGRGAPSSEVPIPPLAALAAGGRRRRALWLALATLLAVGLGAVAVLHRDRTEPGRALPLESIAVLPFLPLSGGEDAEMLGLAMADALITRLSELEPLVVRPTSAVQELRGGRRDPLAVGRRLAVDAVIDGSLQRSGDRLRVSLRLLRVSDGAPLWAGSFETVYTDPFAVQDAISSQVAEGFSLRLAARRSRQLGTRGTGDPEAYQEYVRGRYFWNRRTEGDLRKALEHFRRALGRDPAFAAAHAGIADCWALLPLYGNVPPREAFPLALAASRQALDLDPELAEAHTSLAYSRFFFDWDWQGAEESFRRAQRLDPGYPTAAHWYAFLLSALGRHDEAIAQARLAQQLDPLSLVINADLGLVLYFARRYDEAIAQFARTVELDPRFAYARFGLALAHAASGRHDEALAEAEQAVELSGGSAVNVGARGYVLGLAGRDGEARSVLAALEQRSRQRPVQAGAFALVHVGLAERDAAFGWLDQAYRDRSRFVVFLQVWPIYDRLRDDPRLAGLIRQVGLPAGRPRLTDMGGGE